MRKKRLFIIVSFIAIMFLGLTIAYASPYLTIKGEGLGGNKIKISWDNPYGDAKNYPYGYRLYKSTDGGSSYNTISMWTENDEVKVLNIYPTTQNVTFYYKDGTSANLSKSASMKVWMEGGTMIENGMTTSFENYGRDIASGRQLIKVDPVSYDAYNANPDGYLKDNNGNYKYDVIAFGTWDANNWYDLNQTSANATIEYIKSGRGVFFGHDTLYEETSPLAFATLSPYVNVTELPTGTVSYNGEISSDTGRGILSGGLAKVKITDKSTLTSYPWNIGDVGTILTIPSAHNLQAAHGKILMRFEHDAYSTSDRSNPENFFLTVNNNTAMSQTGHSDGASTEDERKIIANSLFYLKQINSAEYASDNDVVDQIAPSSLSASFMGCATGDEYKKTIKLQAQDRGTSYKYYVEGMPQTQGHGINMRSNTISQEYTSGVDSFWYTINDSPNAISKPNANQSDWQKATDNAYSFTTQALNNTKAQYVHYFSKDQSGNVSNEAIYTIQANRAPVISIQPKVFYENQFTTTQWQNDVRNKGLLAMDAEDGVLTSRVQLISDTTNVNQPGTYKVTYTVKDNGCVTTTFDNTVTVKFNNPPVIKAKNYQFYEDEITKQDWLTKFQMKDVSASDVEDGVITEDIQVISDNVDPTIPGIYNVVYTVVDQYGKTDTEKATVTIKYNYAPLITAPDKKYMQGEFTPDEWKDHVMDDVEAIDVEDGDITRKVKVIEDDVEIDTVGFYRVKYEVVDAYGKKHTKSIQVEVVLNIPPIIQAKNKSFYENELTEVEWDEEILKEVTAFDSEDGDISQLLIIKDDTVNVTKAGSYEVTYSISDSGGKTTDKTIDVTIKTNHEPKLEIIAENKRFVEGQYTVNEWINQIRLENVSASDIEDTDITDDIVIIEDTVKTDKHGIYEVTYKVTDKYGKSTEKKIKVTVEENLAPVIHASEKWFDVKDTIDNRALLKNVIAFDDIDGEISEQVIVKETNIEKDKTGDYTVTYYVVDSLGKETTLSIPIHISDKGNKPTPPPVDPPVPPSDEDAVIFANGKKYGTVELTKIMEESNYMDIPYDSVTFGVYAAEDILYKNTSVLKKDNLIGIISLNEEHEGNATVYHEGYYYVQEIAVNEQYVLSDKKYYFKFEF